MHVRYFLCDVEFVLDYAPRDPVTGDFIAQSLSFLDTYVTDPPCPKMQVVLIVDYDIPVATDISPSGKQTFTLRINWVRHDARTGPTTRNIVMATAQLDLKYRPHLSRYLPHKNRRYWDYQLPETLPLNISLHQTPSLLGASNKAHAVGLAKLRTTAQVKMLDTIIYRPQGLQVWGPPDDDFATREPGSSLRELP